MAGAPFHTVARSCPTHSAIPTGSTRSMTIAVPPHCGTSSVERTCMFKMVSGKQSAFLRSCPNPRARMTIIPGSIKLCWEWTAPFGNPVVPLV